MIRRLRPRPRLAETYSPRRPSARRGAAGAAARGRSTPTPAGNSSPASGRSEPGCWKVRYTEEEYCRILEGRSRLAASDGSVAEVGPGDEFIIPRGFEGTWEVIERTRKVYVIYEAGA
jgi:uncharacterized cupin superfamily protein